MKVPARLIGAPTNRPGRLAAYNDALQNWNITDYIQFELTEESHRWIRREIGDITLAEIRRLM
jgi:hypothetical protein